MNEYETEYYKNPNHCENCREVIQFTRCLSDTRRKRFCNSSCAAIFNNKKYPKRKRNPEHLYDSHGHFKDICPVCDEFKCRDAKMCMECKKALALEERYQTSVKDFVYNNGNARVKYSQIRKIARQFIELWEIPFVCIVCGYDKHVHVCHIRPIAEFEKLGRIIDVNNPSNLICLCPNHHWELDHGHLDIGSIV